jgi:long-chain fatty acid transport protein
VRSTRIFALAAALATSASGVAHASGWYFSERGVRPLGRGGAFVAGADDFHSTWYNPAGLADAGNSFLIDLAWLNYDASFTRKTQVVDAGGTVRNYEYPTVDGSTPILPIPTLGGTFGFGSKKEWTIAAGLFAPYTAITSWPETVNGQPSPSRYSLVTLDGSALVGMGVFLSYKPIEQLRFGLGLDALAGTFASRVFFTASPADRLLAAPEDPAYDTLSQLTVGPIFAPSVAMGSTIVPSKYVRFGLSGHLPYWVSSAAHVKTRLPTAPEFDNARQVGDGAHVHFRLPAIFRIGVEVRPTELLRIEAAYSVEFWSLHDTIDITPTNLTLVGVTGFPSPFPVSKISIPRNFRDASSFRLGGEYHIPLRGWAIDVRLGLNFDQSGIPKPYLSPLTVDLDKITIAGGVGINVGKKWRFDMVYARVVGIQATVDPAEAKIPRINPVHGYPTPVEAINGGKYSAGANVLGVGLQYKF